jgi:hypothetical protein
VAESMHYPGISLERLRKTTRVFRLMDIPVKISTSHYPARIRHVQCRLTYKTNECEEAYFIEMISVAYRHICIRVLKSSQPISVPVSRCADSLHPASHRTPVISPSVLRYQHGRQ